MSKVINWQLVLHIKDDGQYKKLVKYLGDSLLYSFEVEPNYMLTSSTTHQIIINCSWTNNLSALTKWINKNISDDID